MSQDSTRARDLLFRSMQRTFPVNVVAVILQKDPAASESVQRVKIERSKDGKLRQTVLAPLRLQGIGSVDNGERYVTYLPDDKLIVDQLSPQQMPSDSLERIQLAAQNYTLGLDAQTRVAGRRCYVVTAVPKAAEMDVRRFFLDAATGYPLRLETVSGATRVIRFDTIDISYPARLEPDLFDLPVPTTGVSRVVYEDPEELDVQKAQKVFGFRPILPAELPFGFRILGMQYNDTPKWRSLAIRVSDGLIRGTVYQWKSSSGSRNATTSQGRTMLNNDGVSVMFVADISQSVREKLLNAFGAGRYQGAPHSSLESHWQGPGLIEAGELTRFSTALSPITAVWSEAPILTFAERMVWRELLNQTLNVKPSGIPTVSS